MGRFQSGPQPGVPRLPPGLDAAEASPLPGAAWAGLARVAVELARSWVVAQRQLELASQGCADLRATFIPGGGGWVGAYTQPGCGLGLGSCESSPSRRDGGPQGEPQGLC